MKAYLKTILKFAPVLLMLFVSCKKEEPTAPGSVPITPTTANLSGIITDSNTSQPLSGASIILQNTAGTNSTTSGASGTYSFSVDLGTTTPLASNLTVSAPGHYTQVVSLTLSPGSTVQNVILQTDTTAPVVPVSGYANTLAYVGPAGIRLSVYGVGGQESAIFTFEVRDSLGFPITSNRADTVTFTISGVPVTGGAYVSPGAGITGGSGRVAAVINSGTVSGSLELTASLRRDADGVILVSSPVKVLVYGGKPDQTHFAVGANPNNVFGYYIIGRTSTITALVGDKYGNPTAPGTAVYFGNPQQGVITTNTGFTDERGFATGLLITGANHAPNGLGYVYARTIGENLQTVLDSVMVLFSGNAYIANIVAAAPPLAVDNTTQAVVNFNVWDERNNPLAAGTTIAAEIVGASAIVSTVSPTSALGDVISPFWTNFSVTVSKNLEAVPVVTGPFTLTITVNGPNGSATGTIQGTVN